jgi:hypothetical protein
MTYNPIENNQRSEKTQYIYIDSISARPNLPELEPAPPDYHL